MKIGIDIGGSHIAIGVVDNQNKIIEKIEKRLTSIEKKEIKTNIENYIIKNVEELKQKYKIQGIGMAVPGTIYQNNIIKSVNLGIKEEYNLKEIIEEKLQIPATIKNDAKCAALAENKIGCLKGVNRAIFLTLGTGIGGAVVIDGKLLNTGKYSGAEFGHMIIEKDGRQCNCGNLGCFEAYASMKAFKNKLRKELGLTEKTRGEELIAIINSTKEGDKNYEKIQKTIQEYIEYLTIGISNLINIFEPEAIGIGGSFVFFESILLEKLKTNIIKQNLVFNKRKEIIINPAVLLNDAGIIGAVINKY